MVLVSRMHLEQRYRGFGHFLSAASPSRLEAMVGGVLTRVSSLRVDLGVGGVAVASGSRQTFLFFSFCFNLVPRKGIQILFRIFQEFPKTGWNSSNGKFIVLQSQTQTRLRLCSCLKILFSGLRQVLTVLELFILFSKPQRLGANRKMFGLRTIFSTKLRQDLSKHRTTPHGGREGEQEQVTMC